MQLPEASFADIAVALREQTMRESGVLTDLAKTAIKIGLEPDTCNRMIADAQRHADLIFAAHTFFKTACEPGREAQVRGMFAEPHPPVNDNVKPAWRRAFVFLFGGARGR
jgi:hypothetical protein